MVIDGVHHVAAARMSGLLRIDASVFTGGPDGALIEFVRRNVQHGLPLTLRERKWAAGRVLTVHPDWSDRRIAGIGALSPKTVGRLRIEPGGCVPDGEAQLDASVRVGRDNRLRPVNGGSARERVAAALRENPGASLQSVAAVVGVSPETVRSVRIGMAHPDVPPAAETVEPDEDEHGSTGPVLDVIAEDLLTFEVSTTGETAVRGLSAVPDNASAWAEFVGWFDQRGVDAAECARWLPRVPMAFRADIAA